MSSLSSEALLTKANESFVDEDYTTALSFYSQAIELSQTNEQAFSKRAYCNYLLENYEDCVTDAAHCLALNPNNHKALLRKGMGLLALENYQMAKSCFLDGETKFTKKEPWMEWVQKCNNNQGEEEGIMTISDIGLTNRMKKFGEEEPVLGWSERPTMGESLTTFSEFTSGLSSPMLMRKGTGGGVSPVPFGESMGRGAMSEEEKKVEALKEKELGNKCYLQSDYEEAIEHYTNAIALQPDNHLLYTNRASAYFRDEQLENALEDAFKSIKINNKWSKGYYRAGVILIQLGKHEEGLTILRESLQICTEEDGKEKEEGKGKEGKSNKDIHLAIELGEVFLEASKLGFTMRMAPVNSRIHENIFYNLDVLRGQRFADLATAVTMTLGANGTRCVRQAFVDQMGKIVSLESSVSDQTIISRLNSGEINQIYVFVVVTTGEEGVEGGVRQKYNYKEPKPGGGGESSFEIFPLSVIQLDVLDLTLTLLAREVSPNLHINKILKC